MRNYTYKQLTFPDPLDVISLSAIKEYLRIDSTDTSENNVLTLLIQSAVGFCESYTKRELLIKQFVTYRDYFSFNIELRRSALTEIDTVKYYIDDVLTTLVDTVYYNTLESDYSSLLLVDGQSYPSVDNKYQAVEITFKAGYSTDNTSIPDELLLGLSQHIAYMYENRGDCDNGSIPMTTKLIYNQYRIEEISI